MEKSAPDCRPGAGRPRCPRKDAAILDAALTLLARRGFTRMTLDEVARTAGVSKATIHLRWRSKSALAAAALGTLRPRTAPPAAAPAPLTAADLHADLCAQLADFAAALRRAGGTALVGTCLAEEQHTPELLRLLREHAVRPRLAALRASLDRARREGVGAAADPDALASALLGAVCADHLAGRDAGEDWAGRTVVAVLGPPRPPGTSAGPAGAAGPEGPAGRGRRPGGRGGATGAGSCREGAAHGIS
ncbi:TetR/AcrR family transcriptional regulator [Streptacidiphilus sp. ASG 303]|uniref:TetR/AcrR family transcriptional regulator n=1 Tax=Streptacidiphilus sp. ASG 303 TaxID=2896847 RepID=UPI001E5310F7|nr:TetR/AcrR family transcriptional regulator [Streptacidiphilus sp. ASG 303]MCD0486468.1 TetR/AcrR family transcriptional regulator [Streptacidiphilus sp. ASG 303]